MKTLLLTFLALISLQLNAQTWIPVPDANFQNYLTAHYPATAFMTSGGNFYIDADHPDIQAEDSLDVQSQTIASIDGIQAFENLTVLNCYDNQLTVLPPFPVNLVFLDCSKNQLTSLPALPGSLVFLYCINNQLTGLPALPGGLEVLNCTTNQLITLPVLPSTLQVLGCSHNQLTALPGLPSSLLGLSCSYNPITTLPALPATLFSLRCDSVPLTPWVLTLPSSLTAFSCSYNSLTTLPQLPATLTNLICAGNQLSALPVLPGGITFLNCMNNQIHCFEPFPPTLQNLFIDGNPFTCIPNYLPTSGSDLLTFSLCDANNLNGCVAANGVEGTVFYDVNTNCISTGQALTHVPMSFYDSNGILIISSTNLANGNYFFSAGVGSYELMIDTANLVPVIQVNCPSGNSSSATVPAVDTIVFGGDFGLNCTGFDLGIQSIVPHGWVFPGETHELSILAGDLTAQYAMHCASGISGEVSISLTGPGVVTFAGSPTSVSGNSAVYSIADFGALNANEFAVSVLTDITAFAGAEFCVSVSVSTTALGEFSATNNSYTYCYHVVNSHDPNIKQTYPEIVEPGYQDEFNYTIYFQNTGSAPAFNIRLADTLDANLDLTTFKVVNASDAYTTTLNPNTRLLTVRFPNIMLPTSSSDPEGSIGFIQYRVKPVAGLLDGTMIENTAYIYFDYNAPIVTNTSENLFSETAGFNELAEETIRLYPNPSDKQVFVRSENSLIEQVMLYDLNGMLVKTMSPNSKQTSVDVSDLKSGIYITTIQTNQSVVTKRLIVR